MSGEAREQMAPMSVARPSSLASGVWDREPTVAGDTMVPVAYRVVSRRSETHDTATIEVSPLAEALALPAPGQFMMLWAPTVGEIPVSVAGLTSGSGGSGGSGGFGGSGGSGESHDEVPNLLFTIRAVGATSKALAEAPVGAAIGLRGPFGHAWTVPSATEPVVVVAGGLGLAPLRMLVERILAQSRVAPFELVVGARSPHEMIYRDLLEEWGAGCRLSLTVDRTEPGWTGDVGLVTAELERMDLGPGTRAAVCGPEIMMRFVAGDLMEAGVSADLIEVSLERSMACAVAHCGRCQIGPVMVCRDGAVMPWSMAEPLMEVRRW